MTRTATPSCIDAWAEEDAHYGPARRGDELPEGLGGRRERLKRLKEAKEHLQITPPLADRRVVEVNEPDLPVALLVLIVPQPDGVMRPSSTTGDLPFDILYINKDIDDAATHPMT